ncbi:MAG: iron-containing alcohol dehydrogenase, partial [Spirochaetales bacterium]|nr:iron-containing alcohol dehydrogenase [Spirochaetales bacterium]
GMCYAQYLGGMAFNNASLGHVHAMAHQLGGFYDLPHGECNAILLPHVEQHNLIANVERFAIMAEWLGVDTSGMDERDAADAALDAIRQLSADVGIPAGLKELGERYGKKVSEKDIPTMTANAQKDACGLTNPRCMTDEAVAAIYKAAM